MKRARHRWLGLTLFSLTLALLAMELPSTSALKATSLIYGKTSTTAAPEEMPSGEGGTEDSESDGLLEKDTNTTSKYTGIPQVDYVYDPNLPRELNGYNLSDYPFYATVPKLDDIDFKCDGLHDGFYAAIAHKCQVYHYCIYGIRHDFLCANYTAFDQRTFICQFVSVVDCENSYKFWDRNNALYKATTAAPVPTTPSTTTTTTTTQRPQRPLRRRRPYYDDYYDDYYNARDDYEYEERPRRGRPTASRPGAKKSPVEDDYDDERYDRRRPGTARGRPSKKPCDRRTYEEDEDRRPYRSGSRRPRPHDEDEDDDIRPTGRDTGRDSSRDTGREYRDDVRPRRPVDDDVRPKRPVEDDVRPVKRPVKEPREETRPKKPADDDELRPLRPVDYNRPRKEYRPRTERPVVSDDDFLDAEVRLRDRDEIRPRDEKRPRDEIRPRDEVPSRDDIRPRDEPRASARDEYKPREESRPESRPHNFRPRDERKPYDRDQEGPRLRGEDRYQSKGRRYEDRPTREDNPRDDRPRPFRERNYDKERVEKKEATTSTAGLVKPVGQGIFAQLRMPPKIKRPVPVNAKKKFEYVPVVTTTKAPKFYDDDDYKDYDEDDIRRPSSSGKSSAVQQRPIPEPVEKERFRPARPHLGNKANRRPIDYDDEYYDEPPKTQKVKEVRNRSKSTKDYFYDYDDKQDRRRQNDSIESKVKGVRMNVRVVKRPFLPSRGGSPYLPRGLQPVGGRDVTASINTTPRITTSTSTTSEPITNPITTTTSTTTTITEAPTTRTTTRPTTKPTTTAQTTTELKLEEEYEYYEGEEDYGKKKESTTPFVETTTKVETTTFVRTTVPPKTTVRTTTPETITTKRPTTEQQAKHLATKVLRLYNENYEAIRDKLESTLSPGDYAKPYLATPKPVQEYRPKVQPHPEISKPNQATSKPFINENIYIKQNLADSIDNDYDVRLNEALAPKFSPRIPTGFSIPDRDYTFSRYRNIQPEPQFAASEISNFQVRKRQQIPAVSLRTPNSFFIQPQRMMFDEINRFPRQLYRPEFF